MGSKGMMWAWYSTPLGGVHSATGVPPTHDSTAPTGTSPPSASRRLCAVSRQTADAAPPFDGPTANHVLFCGVLRVAGSRQTLPCTVDPAPPLWSPDCQKKRIGLVVGSAASASVGVCGACSRPDGMTVAPHIPKPMLDCPPHRRTSPQATSSSVSVTEPSVAVTTELGAADTAGRATSHDPLDGGGDVAVTVAPPGTATVTVTAAEALPPKTRVPCPRCRIIPDPNCGRWNSVPPPAAATAATAGRLRDQDGCEHVVRFLVVFGDVGVGVHAEGFRIRDEREGPGMLDISLVLAMGWGKVFARGRELVVCVVDNLRTQSVLQDSIQASAVPVISHTTTVVAVPDQVLDGIVVDTLVLIEEHVDLLK
mmetsp:Transcript_24998/g.75325  ORF Transcript_24998/g.75325 Transcript_24998/m.75325 type:complete len:367 (-) Transcript_24998:10836-11936(-)